jgi:hypothetical protein
MHHTTPAATDISGCKIVARQRTGDETSLAIINVDFGGATVAGELAASGELRMPRGISIAPPLRERLEAAAQQATLVQLIETWSKRRKP